MLARRLHHEFAYARELMPNYKDDPTFKLLIDSRIREGFLMERLEEEQSARIDEKIARLQATRRHAEALGQAAETARAETLRAVQAAGLAPRGAGGNECAQRSGPTVGEVIDRYLTAMEQQGPVPMLKKHRTCLPLLKTMIDSTCVSELRQAHINKFFEKVQRLPPNWAKKKELEGSSWLAIANSNTGETIAPATFDGTYRASVSAFLSWAVGNFQDEGFPTTLTLRHISYTGDRAEGENKQRDLTPEELKRLFHNEELRRLAADPANVHKFWILALALHTGARIRELCQINPQEDWRCEDGIPVLSIDDSTGADVDVVKSVKNAPSKRVVPIHPALIEAGFLTYLTTVKEAGVRRLFPQWRPKEGKASWRAEEWIRDFFKKIGLRDDTPGQRVVGAHAFRSTFVKAGINAGIDKIGTLTGHSGDMDPQVASYAGGSNAVRAARKLEELRKIKFDIDLANPPPPTLDARMLRSS